MSTEGKSDRELLEAIYDRTALVTKHEETL